MKKKLRPEELEAHYLRRHYEGMTGKKTPGRERHSEKAALAALTERNLEDLARCIQEYMRVDGWQIPSKKRLNCEEFFSPQKMVWRVWLPRTG